MLARKIAESGSQTKFSQKTGITQGYLSKLLHDDRAPGTKVGRVLSGLGIPLDAWFQPAEEAPPTAPQPEGDAA